MTTTLRGKIKRMSVDYVIQHNSLRTFVKCNKISNSITITAGTCNNTQMAIKVFTRLKCFRCSVNSRTAFISKSYYSFSLILTENNDSESFVNIIYNRKMLKVQCLAFLFAELCWVYSRPAFIGNVIYICDFQLSTYETTQRRRWNEKTLYVGWVCYWFSSSSRCEIVDNLVIYRLIDSFFR